MKGTISHYDDTGLFLDGIESTDPPVSEIVDGLYVGTVENAREFDGTVICVLERWPTLEPAHALWIPILTFNDLSPHVLARPGQLDLVAAVVDAKLAAGKVLVHCAAGIERSPLSVAWYFRKYRRMTWGKAYQALKKARPIVQDRRCWLPEQER